MENKKYTMADLLAEFGDGFDNNGNYNKYDEVHEEEVVEETTIEPQIIEEKEEKQEPKQKDITIKCKKCENDFVWTVKDQEFYKEKGFFKPAYCKECRKKTKVVNNFHKDM